MSENIYPKKLMIIVNVNQFGYSVGHYNYCKYLRNYFDIIYICRDLGLKKFELDGIKVLYNIPNNQKIIKLLNFITLILRQCYYYKPNIIYIVYFKACFLIPLFYKKKNCILDIRTGSLEKNYYLRNILNFAIYFQSLFYFKVIVLSESLRKELKIKKKKTLILPLGADIFYKGMHSYDKMNLLYVGSFNCREIYKTVKGLSLFLKKYPNLIGKTNYTIIGFGKSNEVDKIREIISLNNLDQIVSFIGRKTYEELPEFFAQANIGVCYIPKKPFYQIQPSAKIFEYSLSGLFSIATNTYENNFLINNNNGVLCDDNEESFCEALEIVYTKMKKIDEKKIRNSLKNYTWDNLISSILIPFLIKKLL